MSITEKTKKYVLQLENESKKEREAAIKDLSKKYDEQVVQLLISLLEKNTSTKFKEGACRIFQKLKPREASGVLIKCLSDDDEGVRYHASIAIGAIDDFKEIKPLLKKLKQKSTDPILRSELINILGNIGDEKAIDSLINILLHDSDKFVRHHAARALGKIGNPKAANVLRQVANKEKNTRLHYLALNALSKIKK